MRKVVLFLVLALAIVIAGCQGGQKGQVSSTTPFIGGTEGLTAKFAENSPPPEVTDLQTDSNGKLINTFEIVVLLENVGEVDVPKERAIVTIGGILSSDFVQSASGNPLKKNPPNDLTGVKKDPDGNKIPGATVDVRFDNLAYQKVLQGSTTFPVQADLCYTYQTKAVSDLCIRQDATKPVSGVCQISGQKPVFNSGAPVQFTVSKESVAGKNKVLLTFNVKNVGVGSVFRYDNKDPKTQCTQGAFADENRVLVEVKTGLTGTTDKPLTISCSGITPAKDKEDKDASKTAEGTFIGYLRLDKGEGTFSCLQETPAQDAVKKVDLKLTYNYLTSKSTTIVVKHLLS